MGCYLFIVVTNGCYLFSGLIKEFYLFRGMIKELVVDFWGFTPLVGLNMGFTPLVGLNMGFTSSVVYLFWALRHPWFVWRVLSPSRACLKIFIPIRGLFEDLYPHQWFEYGLYPINGISFWALLHLWFVWRALSPSVVRLKGFIPISSSFERLYPDSVLIHLQGCYPQ